MVTVTSVRQFGEHRTFDIEVDHPDHQFYLANGLLTSNSHAVSYALDSYMCAYLLTKYEREWLCAYAEEYSTDSKKRSRALAEVKGFGYTLSRVDVNYAGMSWTILPQKRFMPSFTTIGSVGAVAVSEILEKRSYKNIYDLLWNEDLTWKHKKVNKRVMEALIKVGAFDSMDIVGEGKYFSSYKHMYETVVVNWPLLRKKNGRSLIDKIRTETKCDEWTRDERVSMYMEYVGELDTSLIIPDSKIESLRKKDVTSVDDLEDDCKKISWFIIVEAKPTKTKKGKPYLKAFVVGESGTRHMMFIWGWKPEHNITQFTGYLAEVEKSDFGFATMPWKMREII